MALAEAKKLKGVVMTAGVVASHLER